MAGRSRPSQRRLHFARLRYPYRRGYRWTADYPEAELNFSWRLQQLTSLQVDPYPVIVDLDAGQLRHYPFLYLSEPSNMNINDEQARLLREYMLNGGFILVDDFWGGNEWQIFSSTLKKIWPDREPVELKHEHPIFHCVFDLAEPPPAHTNTYWAHLKKGTRKTTSKETPPDAPTASTLVRRLEPPLHSSIRIRRLPKHNTVAG